MAGAIELRRDEEVIGGVTLLPLPPDEAFEMGWQLHPQRSGQGLCRRSRPGDGGVGLRAGALNR